SGPQTGQGAQWVDRPRNHDAMGLLDRALHVSGQARIGAHHQAAHGPERFRHPAPPCMTRRSAPTASAAITSRTASEGTRSVADASPLPADAATTSTSRSTGEVVERGPGEVT